MHLSDPGVLVVVKYVAVDTVLIAFFFLLLAKFMSIELKLMVRLEMVLRRVKGRGERRKRAWIKS